ncbi:COMM domain-containing protein [Spirosoma daeguense]
MRSLEHTTTLPRVVFMDYRMSCQTVADIVARLQENSFFAAIPVVLLSGQAQSMETITGVWRV